MLKYLSYPIHGYFKIRFSKYTGLISVNKIFDNKGVEIHNTSTEQHQVRTPPPNNTGPK